MLSSARVIIYGLQTWGRGCGSKAEARWARTPLPHVCQGDLTCRMCGRAAETLPHVSKYLNWHNAALKILFLKMCKELKLVDSIPQRYSPVRPKPMCETPDAKAYWDVPVYADHTVSRLTDWMHSSSIIRERKSGQLKWVVCGSRIVERRMRRRQPSMVLCDGSWGSNTQGNINQCNTVINVLGRWSKELELTMKKLVGVRAKEVLQRIQKDTISCSLNIACTFKATACA